jgi:hypothetical protein
VTLSGKSELSGFGVRGGNILEPSSPGSPPILCTPQRRLVRKFAPGQPAGCTFLIVF